MKIKDFKALAKAIKELPENPTKGDIARVISKVCQEANPRFDWIMFLKACKVDTG